MPIKAFTQSPCTKTQLQVVEVPRGQCDITANLLQLPQDKTATIHQLTTILSISTNVLFPGHNHLLAIAIGADDPTL